MAELPKNGSDVLELIQTLTPSEKRAFKLLHSSATSTGNGKKNFVMLFDALNEFEGQSETEFKVRHQQAPFMRQYNWAKTHLYEQILDAMQVQRIRNPAQEEGSIEFGVRSELDHAKFLLDKRLKRASLKRVRKAAAMARTYELHEVLLEILRFERTLLLQSQEKDHEILMDQLHKETTEVVEAISNKYQILALKDRLFVLYRRRSQFLTFREAKELDQLMATSLISDPKCALSFDAYTNQLSAQAIYHLLYRDLDAAWTCQRQIYQQWASSKHAQIARPVTYRNVIFNYLNISCDVRRYEDFPVAIENMNREPYTSEEERIEVDNNGLLLKLQHALDHLELEEALGIEQRYRTLLKGDPQRFMLSRQMVMALGFARLNFVLQNTKVTGEWIRILQTYKPQAIRNDIQDFTWMLQMMTLYDANNTDLLESNCRNALRYFGRQENPSEFSRVALKAIAQLENIQDRAQQLAHFQALHQRLTLMAQDAIEKHSLGLNTVLFWLESKIKSCSLLEVLQKSLGHDGPKGFASQNIELKDMAAYKKKS